MLFKIPIYGEKQLSFFYQSITNVDKGNFHLGYIHSDCDICLTHLVSKSIETDI